MATGYYSLPGILGHQGKHDYYLIQCPARLLSRLFLFNETDVPIELRRGRSTDPSHVADIIAYFMSNQESYTIAPLIATVDGAVKFEPLNDEIPEIGQIRIPINARMIIHDGQHRREAIQRLLTKGAPIGDDTIPIMLIPDPKLDRSANLYTHFNRYQIQPTLSKRVLHDHSDLAILSRQLIDEVPLFQGRTELEKTTISNRSTALFTISAIYQATEALLDIKREDAVDVDQIAIAQQFWYQLGITIPEWKKIINREMTAAYSRKNYVHSHTVTLLAIGMAGRDLIKSHPKDWGERLRILEKVDWSKENTNLWEGRAMMRGKMSKTHDSVKLTAIAIKRMFGLELSQHDQALEHRLLSS